MNPMVIDTSVLIKWFKEDEEDADAAARIKFGFQQGAFPIHIPDLFFYEIGNVLRYNDRLAPAEAAAALGAFWSLGLNVDPLTSALASRCLELSLEHGISFYDGCFLGLAEDLDCAFVTADLKLYRKTQQRPRVKLLKTWDGA